MKGDRYAVWTCVGEHVEVGRRDQPASGANACGERGADRHDVERGAVGLDVVLRHLHLAFNHALDAPETAMVVHWSALSGAPGHDDGSKTLGRVLVQEAPGVAVGAWHPESR